MKAKKAARWAFQFTYMHELMASPTQPLPAHLIGPHLARVRAGLDSLMRDEQAPVSSWNDLADAVNILASAVDLGIAQDPSGECDKAKNAMGEAGERSLRTGVLRLSGPGARTLLDLLQDYCEVMTQMPARDVIRSVRHTERRVREIRAGRYRAGDRVVAL